MALSGEKLGEQSNLLFGNPASRVGAGEVGACLSGEEPGVSVGAWGACARACVYHSSAFLSALAGTQPVL